MTNLMDDPELQKMLEHIKAVCEWRKTRKKSIEELAEEFMNSPEYQEMIGRMLRRQPITPQAAVNQLKKTRRSKRIETNKKKDKDGNNG